MPTLSRNTTAVEHQPQGLNPVYNENIVVLSSPNKQSTNFKWLVDIYINEVVVSGETSTKITSLVILPNPQGYGIIDVHRHIENYITNDFDYSDKEIAHKTLDNNRRWWIDVTESFENPTFRFDDNGYNAGSGSGSLTFLSFTDKHPFIVGDAITIIQDLGATNPSYDGPTTVTAIVSDYEFKVNKSFGVSTPPEGGIAFLTSGTTRTIYQPAIVNNKYWSWNGVLGFNEFRSWNPGQYNLFPSSTKAVLTNTPSIYTVGSNSNHWVLGYSSTGDNTGIVFKSNNGEFWFSIGTSAATSGNKIAKAKVGPKDIADTSSLATVLSGSFPIIGTNTTEYDYYFTTGNPSIGVTRTSEIKTIKIEDPCGKYEDVELFFLDRLGSYIPFTFNKVSRTNKSVSRNNYYQNFGTFNGTSWGYESTDRGTTTYDMVTTERITCTSDWLTTEQVDLVDIMLRSPDVYYRNPSTGDMMAITITTSSYEKKKTVQDKLINYTITFEYSQNDRNQRG
jgi:hypothetical protein